MVYLHTALIPLCTCACQCFLFSAFGPVLCHTGQTERSSLLLSPDQGPAPPRDALPQRTQHVRASCLSVWQGTSDAEHVSAVSNSREKCGGMQKKPASGEMEIPLHQPH